MSAIHGLIRLDRAPVDEGALARMQRALAHRGPDGAAVLALGEAGLGHLLLRVNREDRLEAQPLHDRAMGVTMVADARLDNREELAAALDIPADRLATMADSAVLLEAWRAWGGDCLDRLLGDFTLALWDHRQRRLYLARDGMGQRGLYYHRAAEFVAFASEVKALWALGGVPRQLSEAGLARRLLGPVDPVNGDTLFAGIECLRGGHLRWFDADGTSGERCFWQPRAAPEHLGRDDAYYLAAYRRVVDEAIACRVRRLDGPPCLLFSGGFDSGTIAAVAASLRAERGDAVIAVASVLPEGQAGRGADARAAAAAFAGRPGLALHWYVRGEGEDWLSGLEQGFAQLDDGQPNDYLRRAAFALGRQGGARLALDGHGGDYTVNMRDGGLLGRILLRGQLRRFAREVRARRRRSGRPLAWILAYDVVRPLLPVRLLRTGSWLLRGLTPLWRLRMTRDAFAARMIAAGLVDPGRLRDPRVNHGRWGQRWLHMLERFRASEPLAVNLAAAHGLDFTRPFHDRRVVELALAIPERLQFRDGQDRWLARQALADLLPRRLLESGPGNAPERPDMHAQLVRALPRALAELDPNGPAACYVDVEKLRRALAAGSGTDGRPLNLAALYAASRALVMARFINWFDRRNEPDQEP